MSHLFMQAKQSWRSVAFGVLAAVAACKEANADLILSYVAGNSGSIAPSFEAEYVTGSSLTGGPGIAFHGGEFSWSQWGGASLSDAILNNDYFQWGFTSTHKFHLSDLDIRYDTLGNGPKSLAIQVSINGGAFQTIYTDTAVSVSGFNATDIDLSAFSGVTSAVFRLFAWNARHDHGRLDLRNSSTFGNAAIVVNGRATPEPASLAMMGVACCAFAVVRRRRTAAPPLSQAAAPTDQ
ncbi:MAG: PEP-CTERM sorting domain-containing protein [Planctomycetaceae bacterium]|nr:PEP-CTERM sorting domain-containing protein [Planctomycetaceae bacterium]